MFLNSCDRCAARSSASRVAHNEEPNKSTDLLGLECSARADKRPQTRELRQAFKGNCTAFAQIAERTAARAESYRDTLADVDPSGAMSLRTVAAELNA